MDHAPPLSSLQMTPLQKLSAVAGLLHSIRAAASLQDHDAAKAAAAQVEAILASVQLPPSDVFESGEAKAWGLAFAARFAGVDAEVAEAWFAPAIYAGVKLGYADGLAAGRQAQGEALGVPELVDTLKLILGGLRANQVRALPMVSANAPVGAKARTLETVIVEALAQAGVQA